MKLKSAFVKSMSLVCIGVAVIVSSCTEDQNRLTLQDTQDITEEAVTDSYFQDMDDMAAIAVQAPSDDQFTGGRISTTITIEDDRFGCNGVVVTVEPGPNSNIDSPNGVLTVDFGTTGCSDLRGNIRTGKLIFTYDGWRFQPESTVITTTDNYTINGIKLEGTRTLTNITGSTTDVPKFRAVLTGGKITFPNEEPVMRASTITWKWVRGTNIADDYLLIDKSSEASGTTLGGRSYTVALTKDLKFKRFCGGIPVSGIKKYLIDNDKEILIDYGNDVCDRKIVVTVNGMTRSLTVN